MMLGARFAKWGLGLFIFGVFLTFVVIAHYCVGAPVVAGKNAWLLGQVLLIAIYFAGIMMMFGAVRRALDTISVAA